MCPGRVSGRENAVGKKLVQYIPIWEYNKPMARATTTSDAFNAVAEPRRRAILNLLALEERSVGDIVACLDLAQPSVSKHLRVLHDVGLVTARREGRIVLYRTNAASLRPVHEWTASFERLWHHQLARIKTRAETATQKPEEKSS
jgi:DNA-binding transcriptional ArsR family regulator